MKQKIYTFAIIDLIIIMTGAIFKVQHFPGASYLLFLGLGSMVFIVLPAGLINNYRNTEGPRKPGLHFVTWLTCFVVFTAMIFKIQHWPGAGIALLLALPFPYVVFLPVYLVVTSKNPQHTVNNTIMVLMLLVVNSVFSAMLALNVSYQKIADSLNIAGNYTRVEAALQNSPGNSDSDICVKIDDVLETLHKYKAALLSYEGISESQWSATPAVLRQPDSRVAAYNTLEKKGWLRPENELEQKLRTLIEALKSEPKFKDLDESALSIFGLEPAQKGYFYPLAKITYNNPLSWTLIWFDSLETNLNLIKISL